MDKLKSPQITNSARVYNCEIREEKSFSKIGMDLSGGLYNATIIREDESSKISKQALS